MEKPVAGSSRLGQNSSSKTQPLMQGNIMIDRVNSVSKINAKIHKGTVNAYDASPNINTT